MCEWTKYGSFQIDPCLKKVLNYLHSYGIKTLASCCGHGKYVQTIIYKKKDNSIWEWHSDTKLADQPRKSKRYYKRDKQGYFYIPEIEKEK